MADKGDLLTITKRINGGTNGQADRQMLYERALKVLS
ncbi:Lysozyme [Pseudomonas viridiflava]|uniref:Lysozyme n=1 Tax=Pseudomonas viridiflava TaxID=33069 RepID=A0A3M4NT10_PSEVI|nr:Lysozyme [Pseudomonas viridiflava]